MKFQKSSFKKATIFYGNSLPCECRKQTYAASCVSLQVASNDMLDDQKVNLIFDLRDTDFELYVSPGDVITQDL